MNHLFKKYRLPASELIIEGMKDLENNKKSIASCLVSIGSPRLIRSGFTIKNPIQNAELNLYTLLSKKYENSAHNEYNALLRQLISFERAVDCVS